MFVRIGMRDRWRAMIPGTMGFSLGVLLCAGCGDPESARGGGPAAVAAEPDSSGLARDGEARILTSNDGTYVVRYVSAPAPIPLNRPFTLDVSIASKSGGGGGGRLLLGVDAVMPDHQHGMNTQPRITDKGRNRYDVSGMLFHMAGHWELYFDISEGAVTERAQADVYLE